MQERLTQASQWARDFKDKYAASAWPEEFGTSSLRGVGTSARSEGGTSNASAVSGSVGAGGNNPSQQSTDDHNTVSYYLVWSQMLVFVEGLALCCSRVL